MPNPWDDLLKEDYAFEAEPSSGELNTLAQVLDAQVEGALEAIGEGVLGPLDCVVTAGGGLSAEIASPRANVGTSVGVVFVNGQATYTLTGLPASQAAVYIYIGASIRAIPADADSREDAGPLYLANTTGGAVANYLQIAHLATNATEVVSGSVVDDRTFVAGQQAIADMDAVEADVTALEVNVEELQDALGTDFFVDGEPVGGNTVTEALAAIAVGGASAGWKHAQYDPPTDTTTIKEYVLAQVGSGGGGGGGGGETTVMQVPDSISVSNHLRLGLRLVHALPEVEETQRFAYYFVPGISDAALYDAVLTTATVDAVNHTIGA